MSVVYSTVTGFAVVVCYRPELGRLRHTCDCLIRSGARVILWGNSERGRLGEEGRIVDCTVIMNGENLGIARSQNVGIARALESGVDVVASFDQDSAVDSAR